MLVSNFDVVISNLKIKKDILLRFSPILTNRSLTFAIMPDLQIAYLE